MPSYKEWIDEIDINVDYYSAFLKAWIAFNSWYRSQYKDRQDRKVIDKIKTTNNQFKDYIETLLDKVLLRLPRYHSEKSGQTPRGPN